jgi:hypothetical protein
MASAHAASIILYRIDKALVLLGIVPVADVDETRDPFPQGPNDGVPDEWYAWYRAWRRPDLDAWHPHRTGYVLYAGRWLAKQHPDVVA